MVAILARFWLLTSDPWDFQGRSPWLWL